MIRKRNFIREIGGVGSIRSIGGVYYSGLRMRRRARSVGTFREAADSSEREIVSSLTVNDTYRRVRVRVRVANVSVQHVKL